jgi:hypothetical protein
VWQETPVPCGSAFTCSTSWSQSVRISTTFSNSPEVSPFFHRDWRERLQKWAKPRLLRELQRLGVHEGEHQHRAVTRIRHDRGDEACGIEPRLKRGGFLEAFEAI